MYHTVSETERHCHLVEELKLVTLVRGGRDWEGKVTRGEVYRCTIPFIAQYRKEQTGSMEVQKLRDVSS